MSKFNKPRRKKILLVDPQAPDAINQAGGIAYRDNPEMALYRQVATSLWSGDGYYEKYVDWHARFQKNVAAAMVADARFPFALSAFARDKRGLALRSSPIALYVEASVHPRAKGTGFIRQYAPRVMLRADEPAEAMAYFRHHHTGVIPHGMLRGIADTLGNFDEYQLGKYKHTGEISLRDVFRLARPKPRDSREESLWRQVVKRKIATPYTWEVELSACRTDLQKHYKWNELIHSEKLGLLALVRNLNNIIKYNADIEEALNQITPERVRGSGILPFQWYKAYRQVEITAGRGIASQLEQAVQWSIEEVPALPGITLVACDNSGSMFATTTRELTNAEIGNMMGAMALACCQEGIASTFGETFALARTDPQKSIMENYWKIHECGNQTGRSTNAWRVIQFLTRNRLYVDRIILLSDMQCYDSANKNMPPLDIESHSLAFELESYRLINPSVVLYSVNLASQDNTCQFAAGQPVVELAGWSESIFQFISSMEAGNNIIQFIKENY